MNFYQELGTLVLGTRLKRISEYFLSEVNKTYAELDISFEASWFGVFYLLDKDANGLNQGVSIIDLSEKLEISHSAVSQMVKSLVEKKLLIVVASPIDARKKIIKLNKNGKKLLLQIKPVWNSIEKTMTELLVSEGCKKLLIELQKIENAFAEKSLSKRIENYV